MIEDEIRLYASHRQFYVQDSEPIGTTDDPAFWTNEASDNHLAIADGVIGIGTGSYDFVKVRVEQHDADPPVDLSRWDHVAETGLDVRTRLLLVEGCLSSSGLYFRVQPGHYRVRCCQANLAASVDSTGDAGDWYLVQFWPAENAPLCVLKRWRGEFADQYIAELGTELRHILDKELASGNEVVQTYKHESKILVGLRLPFQASPNPLPRGIVLRKFWDPQNPWTVECVDEETGNRLACRRND